MMRQFWTLFKSKSTIIFAGIIILAIFVRFYKLGEIPHGFYWDEAAITYNAWGLAVWNRDEFGNKLPVSFKSFGDYKAPLAIYLLGGIYKFTGLHPEFLRIMVAVFGVANVILSYYLAKELRLNAHIAAFLMAITPWALHFSRFGVEATISLTFMLAGTLLLYLALKKPWIFTLAATAFVLSMYAYHSAKIFIPLFVSVWAIFHHRQVFKSLKYVLPSLLISLILLWPQITDTFFGQGFERGKSLVFFQGGWPQLTDNILSFVNVNFWILGRDAIGLRHGVPGYGVLLKSVFVLMAIGLVTSIKSKKNIFLLIWLLLGLLPSLISTDAPHAIRSLMALPAVIFLADTAYSLLKSRPIRAAAIAIILIEFCFYQYSYYTSYAKAAAFDFQYGYKQAIESAEKHGRTVEKFIMTTTYGQPYIYTLLYRKITPEEFKFGALANYEFHEINWPENSSNYIYIASPQEIPPNDPHVIDVIHIPGTSIPVFVIAKT